MAFDALQVKTVEGLLSFTNTNGLRSINGLCCYASSATLLNYTHKQTNTNCFERKRLYVGAKRL